MNVKARLTVACAIVGAALLASLTPAPAQDPVPGGMAEITLIVPTGAEVFFGGKATTQTGTVRVYTTPALDPARKNSYEVLVRWAGEDRKAVERTRKVVVKPGERVRIDCTKSAKGGKNPDAEQVPAPRPDPADNDKEVFSTRATKRTPATAVNFNKALGLSFDSLRTLGSRIEAARRKPDPVALAHQASELAVAEKVSGKKASLTSKALLQEAAELAAARKQEAELQAVYQVSLQNQVEENNIARLKDQIAMAQQIAKQDRDYFDQLAEPTNKPRQIVANNYTSQYVDVYINGNYMAQLDPGSGQTFTINQRINPTRLKAYGNEDEDVWDPAPIWGKFTKYTWNIQ